MSRGNAHCVRMGCDRRLRGMVPANAIQMYPGLWGTGKAGHHTCSQLEADGYCVHQFCRVSMKANMCLQANKRGHATSADLPSML